MDLKLNADRFTGKEYVDIYDRYRPIPPREIVHQTLNYLNKHRGDRVVDLGCGTGLSTMVWSDFATDVIGVEPSGEMLSVAKNKKGGAANITYVQGYADSIPLPSDTVDIVCCSQSFHWMEPNRTLKEVNRVLNDYGVLVIYDVIWPPCVNYEFESAYNALFKKINELTETMEENIAVRWDKTKHLAHIRESNFFSFSKETYFHKTEKLSKEQFVGIAFSQGGLEALLKRGFSEEDIGIDVFRKKISTAVEPPFHKMTYNYRVVFGKKNSIRKTVEF